MPNAYGNRLARMTLRALTVCVAFFLITGLAAALVHAETNPVERSESVVLSTGSWFLVSSDRESLQLVEIDGNLSAARFSSPSRYPTDSFSLTSDAQSRYSIRLTFNHPSEYKVTIAVIESNGTRREKASYYLSSGQLLVAVELDFKTSDPTTLSVSRSAWESFLDWTTRFGDAFPLWVKLLYVLLGVQFATVGYKWIKFENCAREEDSLPSRFDRGNLLYLWGEIFWKFFLTAFLAIAAAMGGQLILLSVLKFMFLAQVSMLSLWDLYVLGFAAGIAAIAYVLKFSLEKSFDLKPLFQD